MSDDCQRFAACALEKNSGKRLFFGRLGRSKALHVAALLLLYLVLVMTTLLVFTANAAGQDREHLVAQASKVSKVPAQRSRSKPSDVDSMLRWASKISHRPIPIGVEPPALISMDTQSLAAIVCPENPEECGTLAAAYSLQTGNILYRESFDLDDSLHRSFIVHEMVHFLQHLDQKDQATETCQQIVRNEREAYQVQAAYLRRYGNMLATLGFPRRMTCQPLDGNVF